VGAHAWAHAYTRVRTQARVRGASARRHVGQASEKCWKTRGFRTTGTLHPFTSHPITGDHLCCNCVGEIARFNGQVVQVVFFTMNILIHTLVMW
jgi:hypothetical protein